MKKIIIILLALLMFFILCACDVLELSAPMDTDSTETTVEKTSTESEETTKGEEETTTQTSLWHTECEYCGKLEGEDRWFIARMKNDKAYPLGDNCFEDIASCGEGIYVSSRSTDGYTPKNCDFVKITYDGTVMETMPLQMIAYSIVKLDYDDVPHKNLSLSDCSVERGDVSMTLGDTIFYPICGFAYSYTEEYDAEMGMWTSCCADGEGVHSYLDAIFKGDISDSDMPAITASGYFELTASRGGNISGYYVDAQTFENKTLDIQSISSLPTGEYYVVIRIELGKSGYEYIFKLVIDQEIKDSAKIEDYIIYENGNCRLVLPLSRTKLSTSSCGEYLYLIDVELLTHADDIFTSGHKERAYGVYLGFDDENYLCLCKETMCDSDDEIGHSHSIEKIRITKEPCY